MTDICLLDHGYTLRVLECYAESFGRIGHMLDLAAEALAAEAPDLAARLTETLIDCRRDLRAARTGEATA